MKLLDSCQPLLNFVQVLNEKTDATLFPNIATISHCFSLILKFNNFQNLMNMVAVNRRRKLPVSMLSKLALQKKSLKRKKRFW